MAYLAIISLMKQILTITFSALVLFGCAKKAEPVVEAPVLQEPKIKKLGETELIADDFSSLKHWEDENYKEVFALFRANCKRTQAQKLYAATCQKASHAQSAREFLHAEFTPYKILSNTQSEHGLLTGYYEPFIKASLRKHGKYLYPLYREPKDLISVELASIYPELKHYRLRGRIVGNKLVPYDSRGASEKKLLNADVLCYTDSKIDRFFLEVQGSGRALLDDGREMFVGYENQNGHKYKAIGKYLVKIGALRVEEVSLQSIRAWLEKHPLRIDEVLNYNESMVFFQKRNQGATGALGVALTPKRSVAIDRRYIPLGSMLYLDAAFKDRSLNRVVFAQDTGGAIKGSLRADLFLGTGEEALEIAGYLKSPLKLWILLPKESQEGGILN